MRIAVVLAVLAIACGSKDEPGAAKSVAPATSSPSAGGHPVDSFVPDAILSQLGASRIVAAVDFTKLDLTANLKSLIPDYLECVREVVGSAGVAVIGAGDATIGFVTKLPQSLTRTCMATLGIRSVASKAGVDELSVGDLRLSIDWRQDTAVVKEVGKDVTGSLSKDMRAQIAAVPPTAVAWIVIDGFEPFLAKGLEQGAIWVDVTDTDISIDGKLDGREPGTAKKWVDGVIRGIKNAAATKGLAVQDSWFKVSSTGTSASFEVKLPLNALLGL